MTAITLNRVAVWLDALAPRQGAFPFALEWAERLGWCLQGIVPAGWESGGPDLRQILDACTGACANHGVTWEPTAEGKANPAGLCAVGVGLAPAEREAVVRRALADGHTAVLVCPPLWQPLSRVLILDQHHRGSFLTRAANLCRTLGVEPVVLTVAASESEALTARTVAEQTFATQRVGADVDFIVGYDLTTAASWVARWRRCTHLFVEGHPSTPWWRRFLGDQAAELLSLARTCTVLALPPSVPTLADGTPN